MVSAFWIQVGVLALAATVLGWWIGAGLLRRAARARRRAARWAAFVDGCPSCTPLPGATTYALAGPGPAGTISVEPDGLCLCLDAYPGRTFWLAWASIYSLDPGESGGAMLRVAASVELHLTAEACRAVWEAKARVRMPRGQAAGSAATAS